MTHTPGPWVVNDFCALNEADVMVWSGEDIHTAKPIAECAFITQAEIDSGEDGCHQLEAEANARLIAAAPDLLEALQALMESRRRDQYKGWEEGCPDFHKSEALARAAIAKATGAQS